MADTTIIIVICKDYSWMAIFVLYNKMKNKTIIEFVMLSLKILIDSKERS